jgi:predicted PhzF superfamily epimerase YddE/YHI9
VAPAGPPHPRWGARGVVVTAQAAPGASYDFVSRCFFPSSGIVEDPVTGSAHCMLGPFWAPRLGKQRLVGRQLSARGGSVIVTVQPGGERCSLSGSTVTILQGEMAVPL